jgi:hypothetical protein
MSDSLAKSASVKIDVEQFFKKSQLGIFLKLFVWLESGVTLFVKEAILAI